MKQRLRAILAPYGQEHLLTFWDELNESQRHELAAQIESVDLNRIGHLFRGGTGTTDWQAMARRAESPPAIRLDDPIRASAARAAGEEAIAKGTIGAILVAGGQGTRLGFPHPKGLFPIGPISQASLFQVLFEKLLAVGRRYGTSIPLYLMTSPATHTETLDYLAHHYQFDLPKEDLVVFCQGTMPAADAKTGRLLLEGRDRIVLSPDGHGGVVIALLHSGALQDMARRGLEHLFYFQVDNPLTPVCDPVLIGHHLLAEAEVSTLVISKESPEERMGVAVVVDGALRVIEYIDLPPAAAVEQMPNGSLKFWAGSLAIHVFSRRLLERATRDDSSLPFHMATKKVPHLEVNGQWVEPDRPNALKFERFVFDLLPIARRAIVVEAERSQVFAPLKNAEGAAKETPRWVRDKLVALHRHWLEAAGATVARGVAVEVSPLYAIGPEELADRIPRGLTVNEPTYFR